MGAALTAGHRWSPFRVTELVPVGNAEIQLRDP
jgi:hypothetical protein